MTVRNIKKSLVAMEDIAQGKGEVSQTRAGSATTVNKVDIPLALDTTVEMSALDVTKYTRARVYSDTVTYTDYIYDDADLTGIASDTGPGTWLLATDTAIEASETALRREFVHNLPTLAAAIANTKAVEGDAANLKERTTGNGGGAMWDYVLASTVTPNTYNIVACTGVATLALVIRKEQGFVNTVQWGLSPTNSASDNSTVMQLAIDHVASTYSGVSGGGWVHTPSGAYDVEGWIDKQGANISGDGRDRTIFQLVGNNKTGMSNTSATTQLAADQLSWGEHKGFSFIPKDPTTLTPTGQIIWNFTGYSRWTTRDVFIGWCGGVTGISLQGAVTAGTGGPAQWYNSFYDLFLLRPSGWPSGGIGMVLGDESLGTEQATTWSFFGGRTSGEGTGISLPRCNTISFYNHIIEGTNVLIGSAAGTNLAVNVNFYPCYLEGSAGDQFIIYPNASDTGIFGFFGTGITFTDNGVRTQMLGGGTTKMFAGKDGAQSWEVEMQSSGLRAPKFKSLSGTAEIELEDSTGSVVSIINGAQTGSATRIFEVRDNVEANVIRCGISSSMLAGAELQLNNSTSFGVLISAGSPEGVKVGSLGALCLNISGGAGISLYVKESGTGNTGWVAK